MQGTVLLASYYYDYRGLRTRKVTTASAPQGAGTVIYHYDEAGRLIGESAGNGAPIRTYIWRDDVPLAQIDYVPARRVLYFDVDQLNTPRAARDQTGNIVWTWNSDAFGSVPPVASSGVTINLRFPGQYYDQESGLYYNYHRDYDSNSGRYAESDPIGLMGGINTYGYVGGNPLHYVDPLGLWQLTAQAFLGYGGGIKISYYNGTLEVLGRIGTGVGSAFQFDPSGKPSEQSKSCGSGYIARTYFDAGAQINTGVFSIGRGATLYTGNAITTPDGGDFVEQSPPGWFNLAPGLHPIGVDVGGSVGAEFGSYSNW